MSRKFNAGRQSDLLLNEKLHKLFTHLEFISYEDKNNNTITMPKQTRQTAIPKGALWLQQPNNEITHKLRVHTNPEATNVDERWPCLFEGYYHPAQLTNLPINPVHGQLWIDDKNVLRVYNDRTAEGKWDMVLTGLATEEKYDVFNGMDFQLIDPLLPLEIEGYDTGYLYSVPYESFGKYFTALNHEDEYIYCHPQVDSMPKYEQQSNEGAINVDEESAYYLAKAWVHVNPYNLNKITKRLIRINKPKTYYRVPKKDANGNIIEESPMLTVVSNDMPLEEYNKDTMVKELIANKFKYNETITYKEGDQVVPYEYRDQNTYFINIPAGKTEYYAFKSDSKYKFDPHHNRIGRLLKRYSLKEGLKDEVVNENPGILDHRNDYEIINGGILLDDNIGEAYDYIYAITYEFKPNHVLDGKLLRITKTSLDGPDQMWVGPCTGIPVVFMDGLYLEHNGDNGPVYTYQNENIIFTGNDVLDEMQIMVVAFPRVNTYLDGNDVERAKEYTIDEKVLRNRYVLCEPGDEGALQVVETPLLENQISYGTLIYHTPDLSKIVSATGDYYVKKSEIKDVVIKGEPNDSMFELDENGDPVFKNPIVFYNGLAGYTYIANEVSIDFKDRTITIYDFGAINSYNGSSSIFVVDIGENNYKSYGVLEDGVLYDKNVSADKQYMVIVDGIVMSPYNEDITIEEVEIVNENGEAELVGKITITDATVALDSEYTIVEITDPNHDLVDDSDAVIVVYDDIFTPYTIPLSDPNAMNTSNAYDNCDSALVMCGPGILVDRESILRDYDPNDVFVGGQIIKKRLSTVNGEEIYEWREYKYSNEYVVLDPMEEAILIDDCENMVTYHINDGTVMLNPLYMEDQPVTVYAYTYVDSVDEKLLRAQRVLPIDVPGHSNTGVTTIKTNRTHLYDIGVNALSTYLNGVMIPYTEEVTTDVKGDIFFVNKQFSSSFIPFTHRYDKDAEKMVNRFVDEDMYNVLQALNDNTQLTDEIIVTDKYGIKDHCLPLKYFNSEHQLEQAKALRRYINNEMQNNKLLYLIENVENNELVSCRRQWNAPRNDNGNLPNSYVTTMKLMPGIINIYVNGVLQDKSDYAIFDNNKLVIGYDLVGGQELLPKDYGDYKHPYRVLTDEGFKFIECEGADEVLIEVRDDLKVKKRTYEIQDISYETYSFDILDYGYPVSLSDTKDLIKIYINGVLYDGKYTNTNGVITLLECSLEEDPLYKYLRMNPEANEQYEKLYGKYIKYSDTITFEWR